MIDGTDVLYETYEKRRSNMTHDERPRRGPDEPPIGHHDSISDIAVTKLPQNFLISTSKDGVVKVWKWNCYKGGGRRQGVEVKLL